MIRAGHQPTIHRPIPTRSQAEDAGYSPATALGTCPLCGEKSTPGYLCCDPCRDGLRKLPKGGAR